MNKSPSIPIQSVAEIFNGHQNELNIKTDKLLSKLLLAEWIFGIVLAGWFTPLSWEGNQATIHLNLYLAVFLGAILSLFPFSLVKLQAGARLNRYVIAISQMLFTTLFIHFTGGRIETHFQIFGSLAFLAFYREWQIIVVASVFTLLDHLFRGAFWPESVYGTMNASYWRAVEHSAWVFFEDFFLLIAIRNSRIQIWKSSKLQWEANVSKEIAINANTMKSAFVANISHELRTPMHGILSFSQFGEEQIRTATSDELQSYFKEITESGERLMVLLNDLLDLSKLEAGKMTYEMEPSEIEMSLDIIQSELHLLASQKNISISLQHHSDQSVTIFDSNRITQVIRNLTANAIKFANPNSTVKIETFCDQQRLKVVVTNHGKGIPQEELESVFDKFVQVSKKNPKHGGTGLGLAICLEIVKQHGGKIWAESDLTGETRFVFELPPPKENLALQYQETRETA